MENTEKALIQRLNRIEGQVRGIKKMLSEESECPKILVQVSAVTAALNSFAKLLLTEYLKTNVADDLRSGKTESVDELIVTLNKMLK